jgi:hypothetical protein
MNTFVLLLMFFWLMSLIEFIVNMLRRFDNNYLPWQAPITPPLFRLALTTAIILQTGGENSLCLSWT